MYVCKCTRRYRIHKYHISLTVHALVQDTHNHISLTVHTLVQDTYISYFAHSACIGITGVHCTSHKPKPVNVAKREVRYDHSRLTLHTRFQQMFGGC